MFHTFFLALRYFNEVETKMSGQTVSWHFIILVKVYTVISAYKYKRKHTFEYFLLRIGLLSFIV